MSTPFIKKLAKDSDKSEADLEKVWDDGIKQAEEDGLKGGAIYGFATSLVKKAAGVKEEVSFSKFIESNLSAKDYLDI